MTKIVFVTADGEPREPRSRPTAGPALWKWPFATAFPVLMPNAVALAPAQPAMSMSMTTGPIRSAGRIQWKRICWISPMKSARPRAFLPDPRYRRSGGACHVQVPERQN